ncbi:MAG: NAD(P)-dependent glycerol-3-phosphate dehydrogenase [Ruminococcaceae bacterium]|nr:NAD(P)-dependent glycerol-3-phosphate dehydrogenase [Oscillospiraceae bacterium]
MKAVVLGSGGWGTALSLVLCDNGHETVLWCRDAGKAAEMAETRTNPLLKDVRLPDGLRITGDLTCLRDADLVVCAVPSFAVRGMGEKMASYLKRDAVLVVASKGVERDTNLRMSQVLQESTENKCKVVVLSGPSHAEEVVRRLPTGCVSACPDKQAARFVQDAFMNEYFRIYTSYDSIGVELAAAMKNVVALSCGICVGLGFQDNTKALLMTRAMAELTRLGEQMGGTRRTFGGLAGMGDLIVTCTSMHSRNNRAGMLIGRGKSVQEAMEEVGAVVEGYYAAESIYQLSQREGVEMPICRCTYEVLYCGKQPRDVVGELMLRAKKDELLEQTWM